MNIKRTLILGGTGGALAVWIAAAATSSAPPSAPIVPVKPSTVDRSGAELAAEIARLHERLRPSAAPVQSRDLFRYAARTADPRRPSGVMPVPAAPEAVTAPVASVPLKLVGLAEDPGPSGPVRSVILSGFGDLFVAKEGDMVTSRFRVVTIGADGVEIMDLVNNTSLRIRLP